MANIKEEWIDITIILNNYYLLFLKFGIIIILLNKLNINIFI